MLRRTFGLLAVLALMAWIMPASADEPATHQGKVVKVEAGKLTMTDNAGKNQHTHMIPETAKITLDGKPAKLSDLKPGSAVTVTTAKQGDKTVVISVDAKKAE